MKKEFFYLRVDIMGIGEIINQNFIYIDGEKDLK